MNILHDTLFQYWNNSRKTKRTPNGWISGNAVCCTDRRLRGGVIVNPDSSIAYSCFNCGFKACWTPGTKLSRKMHRLLILLNVPDDTIKTIQFTLLRSQSHTTPKQHSIIHPPLSTNLPDGATPIQYLHNPPFEIVQYIQSRGLFLDDYPFYWSPLNGMEHRLIIPFFYHDKIIGYTARSTNNQSPKYLSSQQPGTVFNIHSQPYNRKFIIITEGPIDAISIQATSIMGSTISHDQLYYLQSLNKPLVILPDRDPTGKNIVQQAIDLGLQVSFPPWPHNVKDANDAIRALGRTTALFLISQHIKTTPLKIQLSANSWFRI